MTLVIVPYASRAVTPFPECTRLVAADERPDVIALAWYDGYISGGGRAVYDGHRRHGVGIYDAGTHALIARFHTSFGVNALALHPTRDELAIATGAYDGGYAFEGQLVIWNWRTSAWHSELRESREVTRVSWKGDALLATISPPTDEDPPVTMVFEITPARAGGTIGWHPYDASPGETRLDASHGRPVVGDRVPDATLERYRKLVGPHAQITALDWLADGRLAIGNTDGGLLLWDPASGETRELRVAGGQIVAMWRHPDHELLLQIDIHQASTALFALVGDRCDLVTSFQTRYSCSVDRHGRILARSQTEGKRRKSQVLDRDGRVTKYALGHHDVFNHFIRLDGGDELYFLQGTPPSSHEHKNLCAITASGAVEVRLAWDGEDRHVTSSIGTLVDGGRLARGFVVHDSRGSHRGAIELCSLDGQSCWRHEIVGGIAAMATWQGCVIAGLLDGTLLGLDIETGKVVHAEPFVFGSSPAMVTAIAVHDEAIALGSIDGRVEIVASR